MDKALTSSLDGERENPLWRRRSILLVVIFGGWLIVGLSFTLQAYFIYLRGNHPLTLGQAFLAEFPLWYLWAFFTPLILKLANVYGLGRKNWKLRILFHVSVSAAVSVVYVSLSTLYLFYIYNNFVLQRFPDAAKLWSSFLIFNFPTGVTVYWLILVVSHAIFYYYRYREREMRASQLETHLAQAQLQALKMQLQPHFLFNTLNSISALIHKDADAADKMVSRLGDFLRLTLDNSGAQEVTLKQELEFLKCYLEIERVRFQDRLSVQMKIASDTFDAKVPNLILQPIVENAIIHGISKCSSSGQIEILSERKNGFLEVTVKDDGPGISAIADPAKVKKGFGLANIRVRLERIYGDSHQLSLCNAPVRGTIVTMQIPFKTEISRSNQ